MVDGGRHDDDLDARLAAAALAGSLPAFDALVHRYRRAATITAFDVVRSWDVAEEIAQDAFVLAFRHLGSLKDPSGFPSWIRAIARHRAIRVAQAEGRSEPTEPDQIERMLLERSSALAISPEHEVHRRMRIESLTRVMNGLPEAYRLPIILYHGESWPVRRIAEYLDLPIATVKWRLHHGRKIVAARLTDQKETDHE